MAPPQGKGLLIAVEGIDGSGKTTQVDLLARHLVSSGREVVCTKEPTGGRFGMRLRRSAALGRLEPREELETFLADRREHVRETIRPALDLGRVVIVDRYYFSNAAYQGAQGLDWREILEINEAFAPAPDLLVLLDLPVRTALSRIEARGDRGNLFEREADLERCAAIFEQIERPYLLRLDGTQTIEDLHRLIAGEIERLPC